MTNLNKLLKIFLLALLLIPIAQAHKYTFQDLLIIKPHLRQPTPGAKAVGGFLTIRNQGKSAERLIAVKSLLSTEVEIHEMKLENDIMRMRKVEEGLEIQVGQSLTLEPGGNHLMFFDPNEDVLEGDTHKVTLIFKNAGEINIPFAVWEMIGTKRKHKSHEH